MFWFLLVVLVPFSVDVLVLFSVDVLVLLSVKFVVVEALRRVYKRFGLLPRRCHIYSTWKLRAFTSCYVDAQWRTWSCRSIDLGLHGPDLTEKCFHAVNCMALKSSKTNVDTFI